MQYTASLVGNADPLTQGAGSVNAIGALALASAIDSSAPVDYQNQKAWSVTTAWGDDNIVWGTHAEVVLDNIVWGTDDNLVWGTAVLGWGGII